MWGRCCINDKTIILSGSDFSPNAIKIIKDIFNKRSDNFYCLNMIDKHPIPDNSMDHVISAGALGMYLTKNEMILAIKEAVRMTKPGGSLCFTHFLEENGSNKGSIIDRVNKSFWISSKDELNIENIVFGELKHQGDRYFFTCNKNISINHSLLTL
jgi:ubiquinone/menaquinone biosynthesis C-methylase UbiE